MSEPSNRRDFLKGKSTIRAIRKATNQFQFELSPALSGELETRQAAYLEEYSKSAMACRFELMFNLHQYRNSAAASMEAFELLEELEQQMSIYREDSEVSELNRVAFEHSTRVEGRLFHLISEAKALAEQTSGAFDITAGELSSIWGFEKREGKIPPDEAIVAALGLVGSNQIELDEPLNSVKFLKAGVKVNLGGIGKGYAIDRLAEVFKANQINDFVIHGGQSSVYTRGHQKRLSEGKGNPDEREQGWPIGLSHPSFPDRRLAEFYLSDAALGTSGTGRQGFFHQGKKYGHIIDPRTGWPTDHHLSTTVITNSAAKADALATAFFVMPLESVELYCQSHPDVAVVTVGRSTKGKDDVDLNWFNLADDQWRRL